jgi:hypothetical protein
MPLSFNYYINETKNSDLDYLNSVSRNILFELKKIKHSTRYFSLRPIEIETPYPITISINIKKLKNLNDFESDDHFKYISWEKENLKNFGFAIDAELKVEESNYLIEYYIITDLNKEPHQYSDLFNRFFDLLIHEITHIKQLKQVPHKYQSSDFNIREKSKKSYKYFLLDDEKEAMISGMYIRSKTSGVPLDLIIKQYFKPLIKSNFITKENFKEIFNKWIPFIVSRYPDANLTDSVDKIINKI